MIKQLTTLFVLAAGSLTGNASDAWSVNTTDADAAAMTASLDRQSYSAGIDIQNYMGRTFLLNKEGKPAFWDLWPQGTPQKEMRTLIFNVSSTTPNFWDPKTTNYKNVQRDFGTNVVKNSQKIDDRTLTALKKYAVEFEAAYGIHIDLRLDSPENAQVTIFAVKAPFQGDGGLSVRALTSWPFTGDHYALSNGQSDRYPTKERYPQAFMIFNQDITKHMNEKELRYTIDHEFMHLFGLPGIEKIEYFGTGKYVDEPLTDIPLTEKRALSVSSYSWKKLNEDYVFLSTGSTTALGLGPLDYMLRLYTPNPSPIPTGVTQYDLQKLESENLKLNPWQTIKPAISIIAGKNDILVTNNSALQTFIDTNPGHCGVEVDENPTKKKGGTSQNICLIDGHIGTIDARRGDSRIILDTGPQDIIFGGNNNIAQILFSQIGQKSITGGSYALALDESVIRDNAFAFSQKDDQLVLTFTGHGKNGGRIVFKDNAAGLTRFVITRDGRALYEKNLQAEPNKASTDLIATMHELASDVRAHGVETESLRPSSKHSTSALSVAFLSH